MTNASSPVDPLLGAFPGLGGAPFRALIGISARLERRGWIGSPHPARREALAREILSARRALAEGDLTGAERHASRVHVLGNIYTAPHLFAHLIHLGVERRRGSTRGVAIQALRLLETPFCRVVIPLFFGMTAHPGTSAVPIGAVCPIEPDLKAILDAQPLPPPPLGARR
jgi:hypothetical protein